MQKRSHKLLASALLRGLRAFPSRRLEWAFLLGSVQPDCNPLSYLKGSLRGAFLRGHNYSNSAFYIRSRIRSLQSRSEWTLRHYYTLGKLTHYLADAFTCAHNPHFSALPVSHHRYERELRLQLQLRLGTSPILPVPCPGDLLDQIGHLHRQYTRFPSYVDRDIDYIIHTAALLSALVPAHSQAF